MGETPSFQQYSDIKFTVKVLTKEYVRTNPPTAPRRILPSAHLQ